MIKRRNVALTFAAILIASMAVPLRAADRHPNSGHPRPAYEVRKVDSPIVIDGRLDEPAWLAAPAVGEFAFPWWREGKKERTVAKLLWDDKNLYIAHLCEDAHIAARHRGHDELNLPADDVFEIMLAPNVETPEVYFNIEWNVLGGYVDNFRPNGPKRPRAKIWDAAGIRIAGTYVGTLNNDHDADSYWIGEVAIPFRNFTPVARHSPPRPGDIWNVNFNRHGGTTNLQYSQWSPGDTPKPSFHTPHRFGRIQFSSESSPFGSR